MSNKKRVAIMYDFDGTLSPLNMQEYSYIDEIGMNASDFWGTCSDLAKENNMDNILAYMFMMASKAKEKGISINKETFKKHGENIKYFEGVEEWFDRINKYGEELGLQVEHYIISCGIEEILNGCSIANKFKKIFACSFHYDENNVPIWPARAVNYTTKVQYIYRVRKNMLNNLYDDNELNEYVYNRSKLIPHSNMIYIGDGQTDVPSMKLVKESGGYSFAVYNPASKKKEELSKKLYTDGRVNFIAPADYSKGSKIDNIIKDILNKIVINNKVNSYNEEMK